jgi:hypothetical protein
MKMFFGVLWQRILKSQALKSGAGFLWILGQDEDLE